jgi:hypothetical protein
MPIARIHRRRALLALGALAVPALADATRRPPPEVAAQLPSARLRGYGRLRWFGLHVYDARLWTAAAGEQDVALQAFALELEYARRLDGRRIAERSLDEMARIGRFAPERGQHWLATMTQLFPDVVPGDRLTGLQREPGQAQFYHNAALRGAVGDEEFSRLFFGIWLSPLTSAPALREQLLGLRQGAPS